MYEPHVNYKDCRSMWNSLVIVVTPIYMYLHPVYLSSTLVPKVSMPKKGAYLLDSMVLQCLVAIK